MTLIRDCLRQWRGMPAETTIHPAITFVGDRLELGAGTVLAKSNSDGCDFVGGEARVLALLSAAYRPGIEPKVLDKLKLAGREWHGKQPVLAKVHLALSGLHRLERPEEAAYRAFLADGLIAGGMKPSDIMRALDLDPATVESFEKVFNPAQLRVPKGDGRPSGRWAAAGGTDGGTDSGDPSSSFKPVLASATVAAARTAPSFFGRGVAAEALVGLGEMAAGSPPLRSLLACCSSQNPATARFRTVTSTVGQASPITGIAMKAG